jgi:alginate O-acetyltransferase complex protein AlgI
MLSWTFVAAALLLALLPPRLPGRVRAAVLAALSFAAVGLIWHVPVVAVLIAALIVYGIGRALPRLPPGPRQGALGTAITAIVAALVLSKPETGTAASLAATTSVIGLSYFSLKFIQHLADASSGRAGAVDLPAFLCAIFFLPTYAAGPIERTDEFARELGRTDRGWLERVLGLERVVVGIGKKFLLADPLLTYALPLLRDPGSGSPGAVLLAVYAFALGLYLDFAGYSDLAIGAARCAGVQVRENFDSPYASRNIGQLWQRWHMSLTSWLRDFVFVPVTRRVLRRTHHPLASQLTGQMVTMVLCGLWHGLAGHFALWGAYNAVGLGAHAAWRSWRGPVAADVTAASAIVATLGTFHFFAAGLVLFACDLPQAGRVFGRLLGLLG